MTKMTTKIQCLEEKIEHSVLQYNLQQDKISGLECKMEFLETELSEYEYRAQRKNIRDIPGNITSEHLEKYMEELVIFMGFQWDNKVNFIGRIHRIRKPNPSQFRYQETLWHVYTLSSLSSQQSQL
ncbi:Hypothetical predicted protein [Pelobates cultripes]|uniref:Uncharacterized protein n=1 Tax=Pelobates cultripes TaxID=61616 RepID=A0AAD1QZ44_PELCU|nr:Hypothetical predicted protein [Pelobates cultripes]